MKTLTFAAPSLSELREALMDPQLESAAILLCVPVRLRGDDCWRLIVREVHVAPPEAYLERTPVSVHLSSTFCLPLEKRAAQRGWSVVYAHTHPHAEAAEFSPVDDEAEARTSTYIRDRIPGPPHVALLLSHGATRARVLGTTEAVRVAEVGADLRVAFDPAEPEPYDARFDRQVLAFGRAGQSRLARLTVGIVGLGGTGSLVVEQLAHLGVRRFVLVDDDVVEASNLNRVVGGEAADAGQTKKVDLAERQIRRLQRDAKILKLDADVTSRGIARQVVEADLIFNCTDTQASRHILNQAAYQYLVPVIDMGVSMTVDASQQVLIAGHAKMLAPGLACLWCARHLNPALLREELMTEAQRDADPYFQGAAGVEQPAVISLNGIVASAAVTMMLSAVAGVPSPPRYVFYDGNRARMNAMKATADQACNFCGPDSTARGGDSYPLPERGDG